MYCSTAWIGNAAHGNVAFLVARRQRQLQLAAGHGRIVVEELVKIAHPEEHQRIGILVLGRGPLPHEWRQIGKRFVCGSLYRVQRSQSKLRLGLWR